MIWAIAAGALLALTALWRPLLRWWVRRRLGPYRVIINRVDPALPLRGAPMRSVAVVGGGFAGIAAATTLASRGYPVVLYEAQPYLGGKLGAWSVTLPRGEREPMNHGFHAFFRHYYNLNRFLDSLGLRRSFRSISDYRVLLRDGGAISFGDRETTPILNLMAMAKQGIYRFREVLTAPTRDLMGVFLEYDAATSFEVWDAVSFARFDQVAQLPRRLKLAFDTFARAFFADDDRLSMGELIKSFHFYYLSHDGGLIYDFPTRDYEASLLAPIRAHLAGLGVDLRLGQPVRELSRAAEGFTVNGDRHGAVVLAADAGATRRILESAAGLEGLDPRALGVRWASAMPCSDCGSIRPPGRRSPSSWSPSGSVCSTPSPSSIGWSRSRRSGWAGAEGR